MSDKKINHEDVFQPETNEFGVAAGFWWVEGTPTCPIYCVTLLWRTKRGKAVAVTYGAASSVALASKLREAGWEAGDPIEIARMAESAGCSRHITGSRRFTSEAVPR